jgi:uncharacterized protein with FMN-binding domain
MRGVKRAPALIAAGAIAGFAGVLIAHGSGGAPLAAGTRPVATGPLVPLEPGRSSTSAAPPGSQGAGRGWGAGAHTAVGPGVSYGYGRIAVRVTVAGHRIVAVSVATLSTLEPTSQQISDQAIPTLRSEVLAAQSAEIHAVSGATYTSEGYARSLQAALDELHA